MNVETHVPQNVHDAFLSICSRVRADSNKTKWILGVITYAGLLSKYQIDSDEVNKIRHELAEELISAIQTYKKAFDDAKDNLIHVNTTRLEFQYLNSDSLKSFNSTTDADVYVIENGRKKADRTFTLEITNEYFRTLTEEGEDVNEINTSLAAAANVDEIVKALEKKSKERTKSLMEKYEQSIALCDENARSEFEQQMNKFGIPHVVFLRTPTKDIQNKSYKKYTKHVLNDPENHHMAYFNFKEYEDYVVTVEIQRHTMLAWYRNPKQGLPEHCLSILYRTQDGSRHAFHPDFIMFDEVDNGVRPSIIDPHGCWIGDAIYKLRGMCVHAKDFGYAYNRIWAIDFIDGTYLYLDMKDTSTQEYIENKENNSAIEIYRKYGKEYK